MKHEVVEDDEVVDDEVVVKKKFTMILDVVDGKEQAHFAVSYLLCLDPPPPPPSTRGRCKDKED